MGLYDISNGQDFSYSGDFANFAVLSVQPGIMGTKNSNGVRDPQEYQEPAPVQLPIMPEEFNVQDDLLFTGDVAQSGLYSDFYLTVGGV